MKKPRVVRGLKPPQCLLSRFEVLVLAEEEGFEPSVVLPLRLISSQVHSTTLPPLQRLCSCRSCDSSRARASQMKAQSFLGAATLAFLGATVMTTVLPSRPPSCISKVAVRSPRVMTIRLVLPRMAETTVQP